MAKRSENEVRRKYNEQEDLAVQRYGPKAIARELGGESTRENLAGWSAIARKNSYPAISGGAKKR